MPSVNICAAPHAAVRSCGTPEDADDCDDDDDTTAPDEDVRTLLEPPALEGTPRLAPDAGALVPALLVPPSEDAVMGWDVPPIPEDATPLVAPAVLLPLLLLLATAPGMHANVASRTRLHA